MKHYSKNPTQRPMNNCAERNPFNVVKVAFSPKAFDQIRKTIGSRPAESGGALFGVLEDLQSPIPYIREFVFDRGTDASRATYTINVDHVNKHSHLMWDEFGLDYYGQIHSHPYGFKHLSGPDMRYFHEMHTYMERPYLITPVVFTQPDGGEFQMFCYLVGPDMPAVEVEYCIMNEAEYEKAINALEVAVVPSVGDAKASIRTTTQENTEDLESGKDIADDKGTKEGSTAETSESTIPAEGTAALKEAGDVPDSKDEVTGAVDNVDVTKHIDQSRERGAVDTDLLAKSKIIVVGLGGACPLNGMLARSGVGEIVGIDPDIVDASNICRQGYLLRQVGMKKVDAMAEYLSEINPDTKFTGYAEKIQDLPFGEIMSIMDGASLIIGVTDSFEAQAFVNKLALLFDIPAIWGGFYEQSMASEIVFWIPGVTDACFRCIVSPRYKAQEEYRAQNGGKGYSVSSNCNTIFHSELLDAQIGMLAMAILHNKVEGKTFSGWFGDHFDQNFIQMKVNPAYESKMFSTVFESAGDRAFLFNSVWQHVEPEVPPKYDLCPDCHGKGARSSECKPEDTTKTNKE